MRLPRCQTNVVAKVELDVLRMAAPQTCLLEASVCFLVKEPPRVIPWQWEYMLLA